MENQNPFQRREKIDYFTGKPNITGCHRTFDLVRRIKSTSLYIFRLIYLLPV